MTSYSPIHVNASHGKHVYDKCVSALLEVVLIQPLPLVTGAGGGVKEAEPVLSRVECSLLSWAYARKETEGKVQAGTVLCKYLRQTDRQVEPKNIYL